MSKVLANLVFNFVLIVILALALYATLDWPSETALFPRAAGTLILGLSVISFGMEVFRFGRDGWKTSEDEETSAADARRLAGAGLMFVWLSGFGLAIWILGFFLAAFVFLFLFIRLRAKKTTLGSFTWAVAVVGVVYMMFSVILNQPPYHGLIFDLIDF